MKKIFGVLGTMFLYLQEHQSDCFDVTYLTNSVGFRDEEFTIKNDENKKRFILLGYLDDGRLRYK